MVVSEYIRALDLIRGYYNRLRTEVPIELRRGSGFRVHGLLQAESFGFYEFKVASEY